jgi:predicted 3-demethylubiquinone-9 3-methyltransferase (glyoxalase superfamily)
MKMIHPFLWFDSQAEDAAKFYISIFKKSKILEINRFPQGPHGEAGSVMTVNIVLDGEKLTFLNGGPIFKFNESISFVIECKNQKEVDYYWDKLIKDGGAPVQCGWLKDKFGLSWQVVPIILYKLLNDKDPEKTKRVNEAMLKMIKLDINTLKNA